MPSRRGTEQAITWLKSKMAEKDTLDAVNAEVCYHVITDLQNKRRAIGAMYHRARTESMWQNSRIPEYVTDDIEYRYPEYFSDFDKEAT